MSHVHAPHRVYCAGPLFNQAERDEMAEIAELLCDRQFQVYLPHRDGFEFRHVHHALVNQGWHIDRAGSFLHAAIFAMDVYQLVEACDCVVWNLNGRVPDEGAVSEAAIAWTLGKPIIAYKDDVRSLIAGRDNPLLAGLVDFQMVSSIGEIPDLLVQLLHAETHDDRPVDRKGPRLPLAVRTAVDRGRELWQVMQEQGAHGNNSVIATVVTQLFAPAEAKPMSTAPMST